MRAAVFIAVLIGAQAASAADQWSFVYVTRSTDLGVEKGAAVLTFSEESIEGEAKSEDTNHFRISLKREGDTVSGWFGAVESDDGGTLMTGKLTALRVPGSSDCWLTIHLNDGSSSLVLARNQPSCSPTMR